MSKNIFTPEFFVFDLEKGLKQAYGHNFIIHCHHYNARIQRTIESNKFVNGEKIIKDSVRPVFYDLLNNIAKNNIGVDKIEIATGLYKFLGFGEISFGLNNQNITSTSSHFVEGWKCGNLKKPGKICSFSTGYIEATLKFVEGISYEVTESHCQNEDFEECKFEIVKEDNSLNFELIRNSFELPTTPQNIEQESNIDRNAIIQAVSSLPVYGNNEGLIPAFNVYLANMPQDIYNLMTINFIAQMDSLGLKQEAIDLLVEDAETCALNTFQGIWRSDEWAALIKPMIKENTDNLFGLVAVANALGWGKILVKEHTEANTLELISNNGYEAVGAFEHSKNQCSNSCYMLTGVSKGLMELIYEEGEISTRYGKYQSSETSCIANEEKCCHIKSKKAA